jgi:hypothetical protein|tara:strand:- start:2363 stop:2713 length:351 start_codon:yes stop_codon:yes gene_type:complete
MIYICYALRNLSTSLIAVKPIEKGDFMSKSKIQIVDQDGFTLKEFEQDQWEKAYEYAEQMEAMEIEVEIRKPSLARTLAESLGAKQRELNKLDQELQDEIDDHLPNQSDTKCGTCH